MDLNNIKLPASVVVDLYPNSLVETAELSVKKPVTSAAKQEKEMTDPGMSDTAVWPSLGNNQKNILIIVKNEETLYLPDNELTFLTGILGACKLGLGDVAIVNLHHQQGATYKELTTYFKSKVVLLFDIEPAAFGLPINFPHYQLQAFANNTFLYSPSFKQLENDKVEKSKLWVCLKRLFNL
jgi:hypothetical protein